MLVDRKLLAPLESFLRGIVMAIALAAALPAAALAEDTRPLRGSALVLGQSEHEHLPKLANPGNDARSIEAILDALGFEIDIASNRNARKLKRDFETFVEDAQGADVALIYYSGHGIEAGG